MDKFFELISKLKELGIAAKLCSASSANALCEEWEKFLSENSELIEEIKAWGQEFAADENKKPIFDEGATIENSIEVAAFIRACDNENVSECEICEAYTDLNNSLKATGEKVAIAVAGMASSEMIYDMTAENIFGYIEENLTAEEAETEDEDADTDESESEEDSDDGEDAEEDTAEDADADTDYDA